MDRAKREKMMRAAGVINSGGTQAKAAKWAGVHRNTVQKWFGGRTGKARATSLMAAKRPRVYRVTEAKTAAAVAREAKRRGITLPFPDAGKAARPGNTPPVTPDVTVGPWRWYGLREAKSAAQGLIARAAAAIREIPEPKDGESPPMDTLACVADVLRIAAEKLTTFAGTVSINLGEGAWIGHKGVKSVPVY